MKKIFETLRQHSLYEILGYTAFMLAIVLMVRVLMHM